jgi:hypothetical protein
MGRPRKNNAGLIGRAGRQAIESEDLSRDSKRWQRRKATLERFSEYS